eukprot:SAG31_NODE_9903_length_1214_cov_1.043946_1_plen_94_part_00
MTLALTLALPLALVGTAATATTLPPPPDLCRLTNVTFVIWDRPTAHCPAEHGCRGRGSGKDCYFLDFYGTCPAESPVYAPENLGLIEKVLVTL